MAAPRTARLTGKQDGRLRRARRRLPCRRRRESPRAGGTRGERAEQAAAGAAVSRSMAHASSPRTATGQQQVPVGRPSGSWGWGYRTCTVLAATAPVSRSAPGRGRGARPKASGAESSPEGPGRDAHSGAGSGTGQGDSACWFPTTGAATSKWQQRQSRGDRGTVLPTAQAEGCTEGTWCS